MLMLSFMHSPYLLYFILIKNDRAFEEKMLQLLEDVISFSLISLSCVDIYVYARGEDLVLSLQLIIPLLFVVESCHGSRSCDIRGCGRNISLCMLHC